MCILCGPEPGVSIVDHTIDHPFALKPDSDFECQTCDQHVSVHPDKMQFLKLRETENIEDHGHQVRYIFPTQENVDQDPDARPFWYSVGRSVYGRPELFVSGGLPAELGSYIINTVAERDVDSPIAAGDLLDEVLGDGFQIKVVDVDPEAAEMFAALNVSGPEIAAYQLLWPDPNGVYPDDPEYDYSKMPQPMYPKGS